MDRYAVVNAENVVTNVIVWDGVTKWTPPPGHVVKPHEECGIGDIWNDQLGDFVRPLSRVKPAEDEGSIAQRKAMYENAKEKLKSYIMFVDPSGNPEI